MENISIVVGLPVNITNLVGFYVVQEIIDGNVSLYGIETNTVETRPLGDIELAINSSAQSINIIPIEKILGSIDEVTDGVEAQIATLEKELAALEKQRKSLLQMVKKVTLYGNGKSQ